MTIPLNSNRYLTHKIYFKEQIINVLFKNCKIIHISLFLIAFYFKGNKNFKLSLKKKFKVVNFFFI